MHAVDVVDPVFVLIFPLPQRVQLVAAAESPYFPTSHKVHDDALVANVAALYHPVPQFVHTDAPVSELYVPIPQPMQLAAAGESPYFPASHLVHEDTDFADDKTLYNPAPQFIHQTDDVDPELGLYLPVPHIVHLAAVAESP